MVRDELQSSQNELRVTREELRVARHELRNKAALLDGSRREASKVVSSIECLTEECHGLRGDLQRQETLVVQRDGAIASLRDEACTQWASGWLAFQRKAANAYPGLDLNFDIPSDEEAEESFFADCSGEPNTPAKARSPSSPSTPTSNPLAHLYNFSCSFFFFFFFFYVGLQNPDICDVVLNEYPIFYLIVVFPFFFFL